MSDKIQEVFGQFVAQLETPVMFPTIEEAQAALVEFEKGAEIRDEANAFCDFLAIDGKNRQSKVNIVSQYLGWVESGRPAPAPVEADEADEGTDEDVL